MNVASSPSDLDRIADILVCVRSKGAKVWVENGQLHYKAPKGALTQEEIEKLRISRSQIVVLLESATEVQIAQPTIAPRSRRDRAPLAFSQLAHWNLHELHKQCSVRSVASAMRLCGRLNLGALRRSVAEIVRRHEALRTKITV